MTLVVGDTHGCGEELMALLAKAGFRTGVDSLYLVGDCFDRGRAGHLVWQTIFETKATVLLGNHEVKMLAYLKGERDTVPPHYTWALNNLCRNGVSLDDLIIFLSHLPLLRKVGEHTIVTHAGVCLWNPLRPDLQANVCAKMPPSAPVPRDQKGDGRSYWWDQYQGHKLVVYGHVVPKDSQVRRRFHPRTRKLNSIGIDLGVVHGGPLIAYHVESGEITQHQSGVDYFSGLKREFAQAYPELYPVLRAHLSLVLAAKAAATGR